MTDIEYIILYAAGLMLFAFGLNLFCKGDWK